jgi:LPXTG-site transpeptidase (sortase) family protein
MRTRFAITIGILLIVTGTLLGAPTLMRRRSEQSRSSAVGQKAALEMSPPEKPSTIISGKPSRIQIPSIGVDVAIADGVYYPSSKTWSLSTNKAHYAVITAPSNNVGGNTFIYGHNRRNVFAGLPQIKNGDTVTVTTDNHHRFVYSFRSSYETSPSDTSLLDYRGKPILTLQTCSGLWYQNRQLFTFDLSEAV